MKGGKYKMNKNKKDKQKEKIFFFDLIISSIIGLLICLGTLTLFALCNMRINGFLISFSIFTGCYLSIATFDIYQRFEELRELKLKGGKK